MCCDALRISFGLASTEEAKDRAFNPLEYIAHLEAELAAARKQLEEAIRGGDIFREERETYRRAWIRAEGERDAARDALRVPEVWSQAECDGMAAAFDKADGKRGHYETLFAVAAWLLRHRAAALSGEALT